MIKNLYLENLSFMNIFVENDKGWFVNERWNMLFEIDKNTLELKYLDFPRLFLGNGSAYRWVAKWNEKFILIPIFADMPLYIIHNRTNHMILTLPGAKCSGEYLVRQILQKENYLYIFTNNIYFSILKFDLRTDEFVKIFNWKNDVKEDISFQLGKVVFYDNSIWSSVVNTSYIVSINCDTFEMTMFEKKTEVRNKWAFEIKNNHSYNFATTKENKLCIIINDLCNIKEQKIIELSKFVGNREFNNFCIEKNMIWLLPNDDGNILKIDYFSGKCIELLYPSPFSWIKDQRYRSKLRFTAIEEIDDTFVLYPRTGNGILKVNKKYDTIQYYPLIVEMNGIWKVQAQYIEMKNVSVLNDNLPFVLEILNAKNKYYRINVDGRMNGLNIYNELKIR